MTLPRNFAGFGLSSLAQSFCRTVFNQVPESGLPDLPAAQRQALAKLTAEELDVLAMEKLAAEQEKHAVLREHASNASSSCFSCEPAFPVLTKFQSIVEDIENKAKKRVMIKFSESERLQLEREIMLYQREMDKFHTKAQVLNSQPGQWKIYLPVPPEKGPMYLRFEREMRKALETKLPSLPSFGKD